MQIPTTTRTAARAPGSRADTAADPDFGDSWILRRRFMLRVAGLPIESVTGLRCPAGRRWAEQVLGSEERLLAQGALLSEGLRDLVAAREDERTRRALLDLRRALFNNRHPRNADDGLRLVEGLNPGLAVKLHGWLGDRRRHDELRSLGPGLIERDIERTRAHLRHLIGEDQLRLGLLLASPTLDAQLDLFVAEAPTRPDKRQRKVERSVLAYLYRTACKTSPFSTFTAVAQAQFTRVPQPSGWTLAVPSQRAGHPQLNVVALQRLAELIVADPARRCDLPVTAASGWGREDDRVRYVRRCLTAGTNEGAVTFDAVRDQLFFLRRSGALERMLVLFERQPCRRYQDLIDWLAVEEKAAPEDCERYLAALLSLGMLQVPSLGVDVHAADPLRAFRGSLLDVHRPWATRLAGILDDAISCIDRYPAAGAQLRRELLRDIRRILRAAEQDLGARTESVLPQTLLYEDVRVDTDVLACDLDAWWQLAAGPLRSLERILPAFDVTVPQRITLKGFFLARYGHGGRCDDLLKLVHEFHEDFFDEYLTATARRRHFDENAEYVPESNWLGQSDMTAIDAARRSLVAAMRTLWHAHGDAEEIVLPEPAIAEVASHLPPAQVGLTAQAHFLQLSRCEKSTLLVHNGSYAGLSFAFSRFTHGFDAQHGPGEPLSSRLRRSNSQVQPPGVVFAEVAGGHATSNLNLHGRLTDYEIVGPGEAGSMPAEYQIPLDDLSLEHDPGADRLALRSRRLGCEVVPVYLGYLVPQVLPAVPRTLILLSPTSMPSLDLWGGVPEGAAVRGVTSRPRVRLGSLVLSRRSWTVRAADLPTRSTETCTADWFLHWQRWRRTHGVPDRVFATLSAEPAGSPTFGRVKPQFVDFDSYLSLTAFHALTSAADTRVRLTEMLPGEDALHVRSERGRHVAEMVVETVTPASRNRYPADDPAIDTATGPGHEVLT